MSPMDFQALNAANAGNNPYFMTGEIMKQQAAVASFVNKPLSKEQFAALDEYVKVQNKHNEGNYISRTLKAAAFGGLLGGLVGGKKWILNAALGLAGIANIIPALKNHLTNKNQGLDDDPVTRKIFSDMKFGAIALPIINIIVEIFEAVKKDPVPKLVAWKNVSGLIKSAVIGAIMIPGVSSLFDSAYKAIDKFSHKITE